MLYLINCCQVSLVFNGFFSFSFSFLIGSCFQVPAAFGWSSASAADALVEGGRQGSANYSHGDFVFLVLLAASVCVAAGR